MIIDTDTKPKKQSITLRGHRTSYSLEQPFHELLETFARQQGMTPPELVQRIDEKRKKTNLSSALRLYILDRVLTGHYGKL
jgi:predicted DNA-binding ribbon-helix-helix protein